MARHLMAAQASDHPFHGDRWHAPGVEAESRKVTNGSKPTPLDKLSTLLKLDGLAQHSFGTVIGFAAHGLHVPAIN